MSNLTQLRKDLDASIKDARDQHHSYEEITESMTEQIDLRKALTEDHPLVHVHFCWNNLRHEELKRVKQAREEYARA